METARRSSSLKAEPTDAALPAEKRLMTAARAGNLGPVKALLARGGSVDSQRNHHGQQP